MINLSDVKPCRKIPRLALGPIIDSGILSRSGMKSNPAPAKDNGMQPAKTTQIQQIYYTSDWHREGVIARNVR